MSEQPATGETYKRPNGDKAWARLKVTALVFVAAVVAGVIISLAVCGYLIW